MHFTVLTTLITLCTLKTIPPIRAIYLVSVSKWKGCSSTEFKLQTFPGVSIKRCGQLCKGRPNCALLNYLRMSKTCELLERHGTKGHLDKISCVKVKRVHIDQTLKCDAADTGCMIKGCPIATITNAEVEGNVQSVGSKAKVTCKANHSIATGLPSITCDANGDWTNKPTCVKVCQDPPSVNNAIVTNGTNFVGDTRVYSCVTGASLHTTSGATTSTTCTEQGVWTRPNFRCLIGCGEPATIENTTLLSGETLAKASRTYVCDEGFITTFSTSSFMVTCQDDGKWTTPEMHCLKDCFAPTQKEKAFYTNFWLQTYHGSQVMFLCNSGYTVQYKGGTGDSFHIVKCNDGMWEDMDFQCVADCGSPDSLENASLQSGDTTESTNRTYVCNEGFNTTNMEDITTTCQNDRTWSTPTVKCLRECSGFPNAEFAHVLSYTTPAVEGAEITYACNPNYAHSKSADMGVTCQADGTWSTLKFDCKIDCGEPAVIANTTLQPGETTVSSSRTYNCDDGFITTINTNNFMVTCQNDGKWTRPAVSCLKDCTLPGVKNETSLLIQHTYDGSQATYNCSEQYVIEYNGTRINNTHVVTCVDGVWEDMQFECVPECPASKDNYMEIGSQQLTICLTPVIYNVAEAACARYGSLVKIDSVSKQLDLSHYLFSNEDYYEDWEMWIQAQLDVSERRYKFDDGKAIPVYYWNIRLYAYNVEHKCINILDGSIFSWDNSRCNKSMAYICEHF